ncbi:MAG: GspE/PulE family protein [Clostridiales bacterium]|jgi:type IV pilus assembly protein PilB|nr:GspE/PulE family protein [Clostridiales bacterium]
MNWRTFAKVLVEESFISSAKLALIEEKIRKNKQNFWELIYEDEKTGKTLAEIVLRRFGVESYFCESDFRPQAEAVNLIDAHFAYKHMIVPVRIDGEELYAAFANPFSVKAYEELEMIVPLRIIPMYSPWADIKLLLDFYYGEGRRSEITDSFSAEKSSQENQIEVMADTENEVANAPSVKMIDTIIETAIFKKASDIHIEPQQNNVRIRFRVDGTLSEYGRVGEHLGLSLISRLKVMGGLDISEKRLPQDGRFLLSYGDLKIDFRLSTMPVLFGEKAVIRLLYEKISYANKAELGFSGAALKKIDTLLKNSHGLVLITGPTGSGKSTTMAAFLREINTGENNIITVEDPVENVIQGVNQININQKSGFTFPYALRSILRQDPDVIMIGEIRDAETAQLSIRSALTGHLVFSTLHTNDAASAVYRLMDMGCQDYLVCSALKGVISQRLVKRLCTKCKKKTIISAADAVLTALAPGSEVYEAEGCPACGGTGFSGRFAIYEILIMDDKLIKMFLDKKTADEIREYLRLSGMKSLWLCGIDNVLSGNTTIGEFSRAVFEIEGAL